MKNKIISDIILFFCFLLVQVLLSNFINFGPLVFISIYPLYILTRSRNINPAMMLFLAFAMGLATDYFTGSILGLNAAAATLLAFIQPALLRLVTKKKELEGPVRPGLNELGLRRFFILVLLGLTVHHIALVELENFSMVLNIYSVIRIALSLVINTILIMLTEFGVFYKNWR